LDEGFQWVNKGFVRINNYLTSPSGKLLIPAPISLRV
jgi:hypothetical protein